MLGTAWRDDRGQALVFGALVLALVLSVFALFGMGSADAYNARSQLQAAADAATLAAAKTAEPVVSISADPQKQWWGVDSMCIRYAKGGGCEEWVWWWFQDTTKDLGQVTISDEAGQLFDNGPTADPGWAQETCDQVQVTGTCGSYSGNSGHAPGPGYATPGAWQPGCGGYPCGAPTYHVTATVGVPSWQRTGPVYWDYPSDPYSTVRDYLDANFQPAGSATITSFSYAGCDPKYPTKACDGAVSLTVHTALLQNVAAINFGVSAFSVSRPQPWTFPDQGS